MLGAEANEFVGGHVGAEMVDVPVLLAQCDRGHGAGERVVVTGHRGDHGGAASATSGVRCELTEEPFHDGGGPVLHRDRELAVLPRLSDASKRWNHDALDELGDACAFLDEAAGYMESRRLVARDERLVHPLSLAVEPLRARSDRSGRCPKPVGHGWTGRRLG